MSGGKVRVLVADDTAISRYGLRQILAPAMDIEIIGEATTAQEAVRLVAELRPDVVLLDLKWYEDDTAGISAIRRIADLKPETRVVVITNYPNLIPEARQAGAFGALPKTVTDERIIAMVREAAQAEIGFPMPSRPDITEEAALIEKLTKRQKEVLDLIAKGYTDRQIAKELGIKPSTAKNHSSAILDKLGANSRAEAVDIAHRAGILTAGS